MVEGGVGVAHQQLGGVPAAGGQGRAAVAGEVESPDVAGPEFGCSGDALGVLAETMQQQEGVGVGIGGSAQVVQREFAVTVTQDDGAQVGTGAGGFDVGLAWPLAHRRSSLPAGSHGHGRAASASAYGWVTEEVDDEVGDAVGCLDVHEVPDAVEALVATARWQVVEHVGGRRAPAHDLGLERQDAEHRHPDARQVLHGPLGPPRSESPETQDGVDVPPPAVGVVGGTDGHDVLEPGGVETGVHAGPARRQLGDGAGVANGGGGGAVVVEPVGEGGVDHGGAFATGDVGPGVAARQAVEVHEVTEAVGRGVRHVEHHAAALGVAEEHDGLVGDGVEHRHGVALVGGPRVQLGVLGTAVATGIPRDAPPSGVGEAGGEQVEGGGEVEPAVGHEQHRCPRIAPLVGGDVEAVGEDPLAAVGPAGTGIGRVGGGDVGGVDPRRCGHGGEPNRGPVAPRRRSLASGHGCGHG